jgi:hypothetical protein
VLHAGGLLHICAQYGWANSSGYFLREERSACTGRPQPRGTAWVPSNCIEQLYSRLYTAFGFEHSGPCLFDRPTIASEVRKLQNSERAARIRELSEREVKLSPEAEQITPERSSRKSHPYRRHCDERDHTSMNATRRQLFAPSQPSAAHLPRQPSAGIHGLDYSAPAHGLDAVDCHQQSQPQPQACARAMDTPHLPLTSTPPPTSLSRVSASSRAGGLHQLH